MAAAKVKIKLERGVTLYKPVIIKGTVPDGTVFHLHILTTSASEVPIRSFDSATLESTIGTSFSIELPAADSLLAALPNSTYFYKVEAVLLSGVVIRVLQGDLVLLP